jgi:hypothetical protein
MSECCVQIQGDIDGGTETTSERNTNSLISPDVAKSFVGHKLGLATRSVMLRLIGRQAGGDQVAVKMVVIRAGMQFE